MSCDYSSYTVETAFGLLLLLFAEMAALNPLAATPFYAENGSIGMN